VTASVAARGIPACTNYCRFRPPPSRTLTVFERYDDQTLSFTDATTTALLEPHLIDGVLRFDDDFDGVLQRFDPGDV
jgi:hypothetical protein